MPTKLLSPQQIARQNVYKTSQSANKVVADTVEKPPNNENLTGLRNVSDLNIPLSGLKLGDYQTIGDKTMIWNGMRYQEQAMGNDLSNVNNITDANAIINSNQASNISGGLNTGEPPVRKTTADYMMEIKTKTAPTVTTPEPLAATEKLLGYRNEYGITDLEKQLADLRSQEFALKNGTETKADQLRAEGTSVGQQNAVMGEMTRQQNEKIRIIQNSINSAVNQLKVKYEVIGQLMDAYKLDYNSSTERYDKELATNISMFNAAKGLEESTKNEEEKQKDDARANAQILYNAMNDQGVSWDTMSGTQRLMMTKLSVQSGLGANFFSDMMKDGGVNKPVLTTIKSDDDQWVSVIYKDGTVKKIATGIPPKPKGGGGGGSATATSEMKLVAAKQIINNEIKKYIQSNGFLLPAHWRELRNMWITNTPYKTEDFDSYFRGYVDFTKPGEYFGFEGLGENFRELTKDEIEEQANQRMLKEQEEKEKEEKKDKK